MYIYSFEKLDVWKDARQLVGWIYTITKSLPTDEKFGLAMQLRRASVSVVSNIAEGSARKTGKDQGHFSYMAYSSLIEVLNQLIIANDLEFFDEAILYEGRLKIESLTVKVAALQRA